jgi:hypothetical protein
MSEISPMRIAAVIRSAAGIVLQPAPPLDRHDRHLPPRTLRPKGGGT